MDSSLLFAALLRHKWVCAGLLSVISLCGCGGGGNGGGGGGGGQNVGDFSLAVNPASISVPAGGSATVSVSATSRNGFSSQVSVQVSGLPIGVTASPTSFSVTPGTAQQVTLSAGFGAGTVSATATFAGTSGSLSHRASLSAYSDEGDQDSELIVISVPGLM